MKRQYINILEFILFIFAAVYIYYHFSVIKIFLNDFVFFIKSNFIKNILGYF